MKGKRLLEYRMPRTGELLSFRTRKYYIFKDSRIWNHKKRRFVKQFENHDGYMTLNLTDDNGNRNTFRVHDLVASVFLRLLERGEEIHHKNHVRTDNRLENIEIISASEHSRQHSLENWKNGVMDGAAAKLSEKLKKAWSDGRMNGVAAQASDRAKTAWTAGSHEGHGDKIKKAWSNGTYDGLSEKFRNVGTSYRPAKQIAQLDMYGRLVRVFPSVGEAGRNGFNIGSVSECCNGKARKHHGFRWMWYNEYLAQQETPKEQFRLL